MSDVHVKVIIRNSGDAAPRINIKTGPREIEAWDGDQQLVLSRHGTKDQNLSQRIEELRKRPQLASMAAPVTRSVQDTMILWGAWKNSMIDTLAQLFETRSYVHLQRVCDQDDTAARHRIKELLDQLNTTMGSWVSQIKFLSEERVQLVAVFNDRTASEKSALYELEQQNKSRPIFRVLHNAVKAVDRTSAERLDLWKQRAQCDHTQHLQTLQGLFQGLNFCVQTFVKDANQLKRQAQQAQQELDVNIHAKRDKWALLCQQQYADYVKSLHNPLTKLIQEIDPTAPANALLQQTLDDSNDPHCLRRCEIALALLRQTQAKLMGHAPTVDIDVDADDIMQHAQRERTVAEAREYQQYTDRWLALQNEYAQRERAVQGAQLRLQQLQQAAYQIQNGLHQEFETNQGSQKKLAVASRLAEQRLNQLKEEMQQTTEVITVEKRQLEQLRTNLSTEDRVSVLKLVMDATYRVYHICRTMRSRFEAATQAEHMLRHMIHEQCITGIRDIHQICQGTLQRMVQVAQSQLANVQVQLDRMQDAFNEAGRRIDTLHRGRIEQEERSTGDDIGIYRAIEDYADALTQRYAAWDAVQRADFIRGTAEGAVSVIQGVYSGFESIL